MKLVVEAVGKSTVLDPNRSHFIGRDTSSEIQISNSKVSRKHARLDYSDGKWILQDLNSANGTFLKGKSITKVEIREGLKVNLGQSSGVEVTFSLIQTPNDGILTVDKTQYFDFLAEMSLPTISATKLLFTFCRVSTSRASRARDPDSSKRKSRTTLTAAARVPFVPM